jgi:hypothetical protein
MRTSLKRSIVIGGTVAGLMGAGVAFAAWTSTGTGTATATADSAKSLQVTSSPVTGLFPTGSIAVPVTVTNPNPYKVALSSLQVVGIATDRTGCSAGSVTGADLTGLSGAANVIAPSGSLTKDLTVTMSNAAENACQGASFNLSVRATADSTS